MGITGRTLLFVFYVYSLFSDQVATQQEAGSKNPKTKNFKDMVNFSALLKVTEQLVFSVLLKHIQRE